MANAEIRAGWGRSVPRDPAEARAFAIADGIWRLRLPLPYQQVQAVNAYALARPDGCCLVDCGSSVEPGWDSIVTALAHAGYAPDDVRLLVATHTHCDHFGLAATLLERTGCELWCAPGPRHAADGLRDPAIPEDERRERARRAGMPEHTIDDGIGALDGGDGFHERPAPHRALRAGDVVEAAPGRWHVLETPGHTSNQLALHAPEGGWMISADLALEGVSPYLEHGYGGDPVADHLRAVERALAAGPKLLLPGHGRPLDARPALEASAAAVRARVDGLADRLDGTPRTPYELSLDFAGGADAHPDRLQMALSSTLCDLDHLERTGRAARHEDGAGIRRFTRPGAIG